MPKGEKVNTENTASIFGASRYKRPELAAEELKQERYKRLTCSE